MNDYLKVTPKELRNLANWLNSAHTQPGHRMSLAAVVKQVAERSGVDYEKLKPLFPPLMRGNDYRPWQEAARDEKPAD